MPTPKTGYKNSKGYKVPGVTTVLNLLNKPALIWWAFRLGKEHPELNSPYDAVDPLADIGTLGHAMMLHDLGGEKPDLDGKDKETIEKAENCCLSWLEWKQGQKQVDPIFVETSFVSNKYNFGGTPDYYGMINSRAVIMDIKTGKDLYPDYYIQMAAYKILLEEAGYPVEGIHLLNFGRAENENFKHDYKTDLDDSWAVFMRLLEIYHIQKGRKFLLTLKEAA